MGLVGCYSVHLYCDADPGSINAYDHRKPAEFTGETRAECIRKARGVGWLVSLRRDDGREGLGYCLCPDHSGKDPLDKVPFNLPDRFGGTT